MSDKCKLCGVELGSSPEYEDCGGDCLTCMSLDDEECKERLAYVKGFTTACELLRKNYEKYRIGDKCSRWTANEVADDLMTALRRKHG